MDKRSYLYAFSKISPSDMEDDLNQKAGEGLLLRPFKTEGILYFDFYDTTKEKCKYIVDGKPISEESYIAKHKEEGWEFIGSIFECYVWKKTFTEEIPKNFASKASLYSHCKKMGVIFLVASLIFLIALLAFIWGIVLEKRNGIDTHFNLYLFNAFLQVPFLAYSVYATYKNFTSKNFYL